MNDSWVGLALPFGMIGFWLVVGIIDWLRTPTPPRGSVNGSNRVTGVNRDGRPV